jgi:hypothetical protein
MHRFACFWIHGGPSADDETFPFLFINGGAATLSGSTAGAAVVRDSVTQREIQLLEHTSIYRLWFYIAFSEAHVSSNQSPHFCDGASRFCLGMKLHLPPSCLQRPTTFLKTHTALQQWIVQSTPRSRFGLHGGLPPIPRLIW